MPFFAEHGWESFAVSMRGHGGSEPASAAASTMDEQIRDLASLVGSMQRAPVLVAHSLGGIVAQRCDACRPIDTPRQCCKPHQASADLPCVDDSGYHVWPMRVRKVLMPPHSVDDDVHVMSIQVPDQSVSWRGAPAAVGLCAAHQRGPEEVHAHPAVVPRAGQPTTGGACFLVCYFLPDFCCCRTTPGSAECRASIDRYMMARPLDHGGLVKDMLFSPDLPAEEFARCGLRLSLHCFR